ncbi:chromosome segregation ATPase [Rossellomorea marisflavi]
MNRLDPIQLNQLIIHYKSEMQRFKQEYEALESTQSRKAILTLKRQVEELKEENRQLTERIAKEDTGRHSLSFLIRDNEGIAKNDKAEIERLKETVIQLETELMKERLQKESAYGEFTKTLDEKNEEIRKLITSINEEKKRQYEVDAALERLKQRFLVLKAGYVRNMQRGQR